MNDVSHKVAVQTEKTVPAPASAASQPVQRDPFSVLRHEMDELLESFSSRFSLFPSFRGIWDAPGWHLPAAFRTQFPAIDVAENKKHFRITADLPGVKKDDVEVTLSDGHLTISGEVKHKTEQKDEEHIHTESYHGAFKRSLSLPDSVDADKVSAKFADGKLILTLPKTKEAQKARKVAIS